MEHKFIKNRELTKALHDPSLKPVSPLQNTFEGALFSNDLWFLSQVDIKTVPLESVVLKPVDRPIENIIVKTQGEPLTKVLFIGDTHIGEGDDLLDKMITAMKLMPDEYSRLLLDPKLEDIENLKENLIHPTSETQNIFDKINQCKPMVVVSLGATTTNILLGKREKLSSIHGQFFDCDFSNWSFQLLAIFHPEYLKINPNMKKTAWSDLQKVMERIGKI